MNFRTSFIMFSTRYEFMLNIDNLDRNYDDEPYAYWIVEKDGKYFEVNIWKDDDGNFTSDGKVYGFRDYGNFCNAGNADEETEITGIITLAA
mgnify:CR=1 FL=1